MSWTESQILSVLDNCCENFTFPMLDNGYVYLAASRLSAYRTDADWHLAIEIFGFSPRSETPDTNIYHFGSSIVRQKKPEDYVSQEAFKKYLEHNPNNESDFIFPFGEGAWIDPEDGEAVIPGTKLSLRGMEYEVPNREMYAQLGIELLDSSKVHVFELCRAFAATQRMLVLATDEELEKVVPEKLELVLRIDDWHHPDVVEPDQLASSSETFRQIAAVLETGDVTRYQPKNEPNTHWSNWPDGGTL